MKSANEIDRLHRRLEASVLRHASARVKVLPASTENWRRTRVGQSAEFSLFPGSEATLADHEMRNRGGRVSVVCLQQADGLITPNAWLSWFEIWHRDSEDAFGCLRLSATFYWGQYGRRKQQLLRAEWDADSLSAELAPQPHWHLDLGAALGSTGVTSELYDFARTTEDGGSLLLQSLKPESLEASSERAPSIDVSPIHLGMCGWQNAVDHPECWRTSIPAADLERWFDRLLVHTITELARIRKSFAA